jgi:hypothetical protein
MSSIKDPIREGLARGWKVLGGAHGALPASITCDVAIIGSGAGAGITAELLTKAGLSVVIVEEGQLKSSTDFKQREPEAYASLYQEAAGRKTKDKGITILQGRSVGGTTTVNWTSSFRTPATTLKYWQDQFGLTDYNPEALAPYFKQAEERLNISPWLAMPNENNELLRRGAAKLGIKAEVIPRNVKGCYNLGSCGMGCPTNAKQSMLVTTIPFALDAGATLLVETRAETFQIANGRINSLRCIAVKPNAAPVDSAGPATQIIAKHFILAGGSINSPALLMRSKAPDPHHRLGTRTFLHPVAITTAVMPHTVAAWDGAPQSIYSDHFLGTQPVDGPIGFKLEVAPLHPVFFGANLPGFGEKQAELFRQYPNANVMLALMRDGFHEQAAGGKVELRGDGSPLLDYPLTDFVLDGRLADEALADQDRQCPRDGRLRSGGRREARRDAPRWRALAAGKPVHPRWLHFSHQHWCQPAVVHLRFGQPTGPGSGQAPHRQGSHSGLIMQASDGRACTASLGLLASTAGACKE